jgi:HD-GYP domain-containing protein (c-di-GMP phosphodiesterase class II)
MNRWWSRAAARIVAVYVVFSLAWILIGDRLAQAASPAEGIRLTIEDAKGTAFVLISGAIVYVLVTLHDQRQRAARLAQERAYDETLAGWAAALDLRDRSTAEHTSRVTGLTVALAQRAGLSGDDLVHVRRGATLHDIGKMGVPDDILLKPGALDDDEWVQMRRHPELAVQFLHGISYLEPALDIPWCHHEKWDGSGYPRGLAGDAIPLSARLFAVIDVYDAVTCDRPYRGPMPHDDAMELIRAGAGSHFDPEAVRLFEELMRDRG